MTHSKTTSNEESNNISTRKVIGIISGIILVVVILYLYKFHDGLSSDNDVWGTFGDYVGGILNPVIAAFAFYLIAKSYELQKRELEATRSLLEISTNAQREQIKLAALTALLNSNQMRISFLNGENCTLLSRLPTPKEKTVGDSFSSGDTPTYDMVMALSISPEIQATKDRIIAIKEEIEALQNENMNLERQIKDFFS